MTATGMAIAASELPRHELVGLEVEVVAADNEDLVGIAGEVVSETANTLGVADGDRSKRVPKAGATFEFALSSGRVRVEGDRVVGSPVRRAERTGDSQWR